MKHLKILPSIYMILIALIAACKTEDQKLSDEQCDLFRSLIAEDSLNSSATSYAAFIATNHYDIIKKKAEDKTKSRLESIGGYNLIEIDSIIKCNLYKGIYRLNKTVKDSADLAFLAKYLAHQLFEGGQKASDCNYPIMSQSIINQPSEKEQEGWASMCSITPSNYDGEVFVKKRTYSKNNAQN